MRPRAMIWLSVLLAAGFGFTIPAFGTDVDGPDDCVRISHDFGDAPEDFPAYPGILGRFPTCTMPTAAGTQEVAAGCPAISSPPGPTGFVIHVNAPGGYWLGCTPPLRMGIDTDPNGKTSPGTGPSFCDGSPVDCFEAAFGLNFGQDDCLGGNDAGVAPPVLQACATGTITFTTDNCAATRMAILNVLIDMNQDGDWNDSFLCPSGSCAYEWAVVNVPVQLPSGCNTQTSPPFLVGPKPGHAWMRVTISDQPVNPDFPWAGSANLPDPIAGGETEDYPVEILEPVPQSPCETGWIDFGDAPEDLQAYASGVIGRFPTCQTATAAGTQEIQCGAPLGTAPGPTGFVQHVSPPLQPPHFWLGCPSGAAGPWGVDTELDGKTSLFPMPPATSHCSPMVPIDCIEAALGLSFGQDECYGDVADAGIVAPIQFVACSTGAVKFAANACSPAEVWLNILVDWNEDGDWNDHLACSSPYPTGCAYEWAVKNQPILLNPGCQTLTSPSFLVGPHAGQGWLRITLSSQPVPDDFPWNGSVSVGELAGGETEDYPVTIREPVLDPCELGYEDWGDAPEELIAYPSNVAGRFPTCLFPGMPGTQQIQCGPVVTPPPGATGYVRHVSPFGDPWKVWLGCGLGAMPAGVDSEHDGKVNLGLPLGGPSFCNQAVATDCIDLAFGLMPYNQDECWGDGVDAGVVTPRTFGACSTGSVVFRAMNCSAREESVYVNVLVDWNEDGDWLDQLLCPGGPALCAYEWAVRNAVIHLIPGCGAYATPSFRVGPNLGPAWLRITLTHDPVAPDFPWNGSGAEPTGAYRGGETEDYPVEIVASPVGVGEPPATSELRLAVRPNPSRDAVAIELALPRESEVSLGVYDIAGRELTELARGIHPAGVHVVRWDYRARDGAPVPAGLYLVKLRVGDRVLTRTMVRIR